MRETLRKELEENEVNATMRAIVNAPVNAAGETKEEVAARLRATRERKRLMALASMSAPTITD